MNLLGTLDSVAHALLMLMSTTFMVDIDIYIYIYICMSVMLIHEFHVLELRIETILAVF